MSFEIAIKKAIEFEERIRNIYADLAEHSESAFGRQFFKMMRDDEEGHVQYFHAKLKEWLRSGKVSYKGLASPFAAKNSIVKDVRAVQEHAVEVGKNNGFELKMLKQALKLEEEATAFYLRSVERLKEGERELFGKFVAIEKKT